VFFAELADALAAPTFTHRLALYIGHDGTLVRLLAGLGVSPLRWPSLGSEVVLEVRTFRCALRLTYVYCPATTCAQVWEAPSGTRFIRVFHEGTDLRGMEWVRLDGFIERLRALVPARLFERCMGT
jgi:2-phosphoxylose phosphatase